MLDCELGPDLKVNFETCRVYFSRINIEIGWPVLYGVGMVEKWKFDSVQENYRNAPIVFDGYSEF